MMIMETADNLDDATETLDNLRYQECFRVGRLLAPSHECAHWRVQAFMEALEADGAKLRELTGEDHGPF
jgi:hypothetical protein